jgi:hypothetical protein
MATKSMPVRTFLMRSRPPKNRWQGQLHTDSVVLPDFQCNPQLRADSIGSCDEQTVFVPACSLEIEDSAKPADCPIRSKAPGLLNEGFDSLDKAIAGIDRNTSLSVCEPLGTLAFG